MGVTDGGEATTVMEFSHGGDDGGEATTVMGLSGGGQKAVSWNE